MRNISHFIQLIFLGCIFTGIVLTGCQKDRIYNNSDAKLNFSEEIVTFDTLFTSIGSITKTLKVFNPYKNTVKFDIALGGGNTSYFSVNVDGVPGTSFKDVEIRSKDSISIFIKANINPNGENTPMLVLDSLAFLTNGNSQKVKLLAYGEDANFIVPNATWTNEDGSTVPCNIVAGEGGDITWKKDKPYVIYGYAVVNSNAKLTIEAGTQVYIHKGGGIYIHEDGCIHVNGVKEEPVVFQGDGRAAANEYDFAQWNGIQICEGRNDNSINYAIIKNASVGISVEIQKKDMGNKLTLSNTIIQCSQQANFYAKGYTVEAYNNVFTNSENYCVYLEEGGNYAFTNNTVYNQYSFKRTVPAVYVSNFASSKTFDLKCNLLNNIIYGSLTKELDCSIRSDTSHNTGLYVENCLIKTDKSIPDKFTGYSDLILNEDPLFKDAPKYDFSLQNNSPCKGKGKSTWLNEDITGATRNNPPSIGAYE